MTNSIAGGSRRRLAIVGGWPHNRQLIPFDDELTDILVMNEAAEHSWMRRWDICLQLHKPEVYRSPDNYVRPTHWAWLQRRHDKPIYMQDVDLDVPDSVRYPIEEVRAMLPPFIVLDDGQPSEASYIRSSIAHALALALYLDKYDEIGLYGINLESNTEYFYQASNMAFWIGFALGRGVNLKLYCWYSEFIQPVYGYQGELQLARGVFAERAEKHREDNREAERELTRIKQKIDKAILKGDIDKVGKLFSELEDAATAVGHTLGSLMEAERYRDKDGEIPRQEFEFHSALGAKNNNDAIKQLYVAHGKGEYVWNAWRMSGRHEALTQLRHFLKELEEKALQVGRLQGASIENGHYMTEYDAAITAAGGMRALAQVTGG
jgi:hypothetical protein